tara:strand:- start:320 stop:478 length:159 start_codon:yes stop_codon:yes gene_type:complete
MTVVNGITLGIIGTILTIVGFGLAFWIATHKKKDLLDKSNPVYRFWEDYRGK